jgi:DNA invertase Pin-like site-specific DNA recombinase
MRVAILVRVSSKSDRQDYSRQISDLQAVATRNGWTVVKTVTAKVSATKTRIRSREDIAEIYELVEKKLIDKVLVTELTRIGRKAKEIREVYEYLHENGISIFVQSLGLDTGAKEPMQRAINSIILAILSEFAELETVQLSQRIKSGLDEAVKKGKQLGRPEGTTDNLAYKLETIPEYKTAKTKLEKGLSLRETAAVTGLAVNTVKRIKDFLTN